MSRRLPAPIAVLVTSVLALAAAGCGGGSAGSGPQAFGAGARAIPAHPLAFVDVNLDRGSAAWRQAVAVGARFPGWSSFVSGFQRSLDSSSGSKLRFGRDIEPWLGNEASFAVTGVNVGNQARPVDFAVYVAVTDEGKLKQALARDHDRPAAGYHGFAVYEDSGSSSEMAAVGKGALLVSNDLPTLHRQIDAWRGSGSRLAGDARFTRAMDTLPAGSLVTAYVDASQLGQLLSLAALSQIGSQPTGSVGQVSQMAKALRTAGTLTASFGADDGGFRLTVNITPAPGHALSDQLSGGGDHPPALLINVPAGAFAYVGGRAPGTGPVMAGDQPSLRAFQRATGLSFARDIAPLLGGDVAAYASPGRPLTGAVLLRPSRVRAATVAMAHITAAITRSDPAVRFHWLPGHRGQVVAVSPGVRVGWRRVGDVIAISNDPAAGALQSPGLAGSQSYAALARRAGVPAQVTFLAYVGIPGLLRAIPGLPPDPNAAHLGGFVMWADTDAAGAHFNAYLQITK
jgi:Protein of unknown function (DUF3352)